MNINLRWFFARVNWTGDVLFRAEFVPNDRVPFDVFRLTVFGTDQQGTPVFMKHGVYRLGLVAENVPFTLNRGDLQGVALARKEAAAKCDELWSGIVTAPASTLRVLEDRNGGPGR